ncbi:hypothetical protein [Aurantibacter sp.]|uniref:hypothetical protein n=1 Tax=Aurantibacter sp. TaxID=2807103 RepID=UPI003266D15A
MRQKLAIVIVFLISFYSCEQTEDPITNIPKDEDSTEDINEEPVEVDETAPILTIAGFTDVIETISDVSIIVEDDSAVETKVFYEGEEIAASLDKQLNFKVNPYTIPVGEIDFEVISIDDLGNETSEILTTEIKHLLMIYNQSAINNANNFPNWLFFNSLGGVELAVVEPIIGDLKIYTDKIILEDKVLYSYARLEEFTYGSGSDRQLHISTYAINLGGTKVSPDLSTVYEDPESILEVTINNVPFQNYSPDYTSSGSGYYTSEFEGDETHTILTIKHVADNNPIYLVPNYYGSTYFDGKKENYKYAKLLPESGNSSMEVDINEFLQAEDNFKIDIPEHDAGTLFFYRKGIENYEEFNERLFNIYWMDEDEEQELVTYLDLPKFSTMNEYKNEIGYSKDGVYYNSIGNDSNVEVDFPNWNSEIEVTETEIKLIENNPDVDYYAISLDKRQFENGQGRVLNWKYSVFGKDNGIRNVKRLALPNLISEELNEAFFETGDDLELYREVRYDYKNIETYDEILDIDVFQQYVPNQPLLIRSTNEMFPTSFSNKSTQLNNKAFIQNKKQQRFGIYSDF